MNITKFDIAGPLLIQNRIFQDERGFFTERYRADLFREIGIGNEFIQDNFSVSSPGVLRGLHYQSSPPQGKLVTCVSGRIFDVAVDIRASSPTFGRWVSAEIDAQSPAWLWVPPGFAHGFYVMGSQPASVLYKVDQLWSKDGEGGLLWSDPELGIMWPGQAPVLSAKDLELPHFATYRQSPRF